MNKNNDQLVLNLNRRAQVGLENFYISKANELAVNSLKKWEEWPTRKLILKGPSGSGKSHLADFWVKQSGAKIVSITDICEADAIGLSENKALLIENIDILVSYATGDQIQIEEKLFHLLNSVSGALCYLMITTSSELGSWGLKLPDLISRLKAVAVVELLPPDDELITAILLKQLDDKQLKVSPEFVLFVIKRINRSFQSIREFVDLIDQLTLKRKRDVTIPMASEILNFQNNDIAMGGKGNDYNF